MKRNSIIITTLLLAIYIALVFFCCLYHISATEKIDVHQYIFGIRLDRYIHFTMFFPYPFVAGIFMKSCKKMAPYRKYTGLIILVSGIVLAFLAEFSQEALTSYRDTDPYDLVANITGVILATIAVFIIGKFISRSRDFS